MKIFKIMLLCLCCVQPHRRFLGSHAFENAKPDTNAKLGENVTIQTNFYSNGGRMETTQIIYIKIGEDEISRTLHNATFTPETLRAWADKLDREIKFRKEEL